jgi:plastocyanin
MRVTAMVAGAALLVAACGGKENKTADSTTMTNPPAASTTTGGATHEINMVMVSPTSYKFEPENTTIKAGDKVVFKGVSGLSHNVAFLKDSIPPGAEAVLDAQMKDGPQPLSTNMIADGGQVEISFANAPAGTYHYICIPHLPMGMKGTITVQ